MQLITWFRHAAGNEAVDVELEPPRVRITTATFGSEFVNCSETAKAGIKFCLCDLGAFASDPERAVRARSAEE